MKLTSQRLQPTTFYCVACSLVAIVASSNAYAGLIIGDSNAANGGNDPASEVLNVIEDYNDSNDPDVVEDFMLFKKSDDDANFVFDGSNGFMFAENSDGTAPIASLGDLTDLEQAYFKYTGPANLIFYTVKGSKHDGFTLYTFMPGWNLLDVDPFQNGNSEISHVSFWKSTGVIPIDPFGNQVPEPSTAIALGLSLVGFAALRHRWA